MIKKLYISNYALIDKLEIDFGSGFSVITGETGAGKSIILGALSLILGQRADTKSLKNTSEKSVVEGTFDITAYRLQEFFEAEERCVELNPASGNITFGQITGFHQRHTRIGRFA